MSDRDWQLLGGLTWVGLMTLAVVFDSLVFAVLAFVTALASLWEWRTRKP